MSEPKFCKDCKHFKEAGAVSYYGAGFSWPDSCNQPPERELIHGRKTPADPRRMRSKEGDCKPAALLWEEKPPKMPKPNVPSFVEVMHGPSEVIPIPQPVARWWEFWK